MKDVIIKDYYKNELDFKKLNEMVKSANGIGIIMNDSNDFYYKIHLKLDLSYGHIITDNYKFNANCNYFNSINEFIDWYNNVYLVLNKYQIIKHLPHASIDVPKGYIESLNIDQIDFQRYNLTMSDIYIKQLFKSFEGIEIIPKYSRLFCDVERFKDSNLEPMTKLGQGYIYDNYYDFKKINRSIYNNLDFKKEISDYYDNYHINFNNIVKNMLKNDKDILILDLHSYSDKLANSLGKSGPYPDICIGIDEGYYNDEILNAVIFEVKRRGLSYQINYPYSGSLVPNGCFDGSIDKKRVKSIMIEVNKRIYL